MVTGLKQKLVKAIKVNFSDEPATSWGGAGFWPSVWRCALGFGSDSAKRCRSVRARLQTPGLAA